MKELWSKRCRSLVPYVPGEQPRDRQFIKLNTNENPYPPSPAAVAAIAKEAASLRLYPDPTCAALRRALAEDLGVSPEQVFVGNGSDEVLALAFQAFFDPDRPIRFADVTYSFYPVFAALCGLTWEEVPLNGDFTLPLAPFLAPSGGVVVANPNAPTGLTLPLAEVEAILAADPARVVIVDEAYVDFGGVSALPLLEKFENLLIVRTFSKSRSLAGLRVGFALGRRDLIAALETVKDSFNSYPVDRLAQAGALAAVEDRVYFQETAARIVAARDSAAQALRSLGFRVTDSAANFLFISHPRVPARTLQENLRERGILVRWWDKPRIDNYLRVSVGTEEDMAALTAALAELVR